MTDSLPPLSAEWSPYEEPFHEIARVVEMSSGFVLVPVAVPGPDLARALAEWLSRAGHPVSVTQLQGDEDWERLAAFLMEQTPPPRGAVMVIGSDRPPQGYSGALALVNQVRDAVVKKLNCPLLWCGPREFLNLTWENAPDFWSIRAVDHTIGVRSRAAVAPDIIASLLRSASAQSQGKSINTGMDAEALESLMRAALAQGDTRSAATIAFRLVVDANAADRLGDALRIAEEMLSNERGFPSFERAKFLILRSQTLILAKRFQEAQSALEAMLNSESTQPALKPYIAFLRALSAAGRKEYEEAQRFSELAYKLSSEAGNIELSIRARLIAAMSALILDRLAAARDWLTSAFDDIEQHGDPELSELRRQTLAIFLSRTHDTDAALRLGPLVASPAREQENASVPLCLVLSSPEDLRALRQLRAHATPLLRAGRMRWWSRDNLFPLEDPGVAFEEHAREAALVVVLWNPLFDSHGEVLRGLQAAHKLEKPVLLLKIFSKDTDPASPVTVLRWGEDPPPDSALPDPEQAWAEVIEDIERLLPPVPQPRSGA